MKESMNWMDKYKLINLNSTDKISWRSKWIKFQESVGLLQMLECLCHQNSGRKGEKDKGWKVLQKIMDKDFPNLAVKL